MTHNLKRDPRYVDLQCTYTSPQVGDQRYSGIEIPCRRHRESGEKFCKSHTTGAHRSRLREEEMAEIEIIAHALSAALGVNVIGVRGPGGRPNHYTINQADVVKFLDTQK